MSTENVTGIQYYYDDDINQSDFSANKSKPKSQSNISLHKDSSSDILALNEMNKNNKCPKLCNCLWYFMGFIILLMGIQYFIFDKFINNFVHNYIDKTFIFNSPQYSNDNYNAWMSNEYTKPGTDDEPTPILYATKFFNITNTDKLIDGELPQFNLSGNIIWKMYYTRDDISYSNDAEYVNYGFKTHFYFDETSDVTPDMHFTILSPLVPALYDVYMNQKTISKALFQGIIAIIDRHPYKYLYWEGTAYDLIFGLISHTFTINGESWTFEFGFANNGSSTWYSTNTGYNDETKYGEVYKFAKNRIEFNKEKSKTLNCWQQPIEYAPSHFLYMGVWSLMNNKYDLKPLFVSLVSRYLSFEYYKTVKFKGIDVYQYNISKVQLYNASIYPPNALYNQYGPSGVLNMTSCFDGMPLFISMPNFLLAPDYAANNSNFSLDAPTYDVWPWIRIEPRTGAIFNANAYTQINFPLHRFPRFGDNDNGVLANLPDQIMVPTYQVGYMAELPDPQAKAFKKHINLINALQIISQIIGIASLILLILYMWYQCYYCGQLRAKYNDKYKDF